MNRKLSTLLAALTVLLMAAALGGCSDDDENNPMSPANLGDGAKLRVVHASPDAPPVDVWVNGAKAFTNLPFEGITDFASLPAGTYNVKVGPTGATSPVVIEADLALNAGVDYTVIATGELASITPVILTADGGAPAAGSAWVRFFHASPDAPAVDIAVAGGAVLFPDVAFQQGTNYLQGPAGTYDLEARVAGTSTVALSLPGVTLADGDVVTAYATGLLADVGKLDELYFIPAAARGEGDANSYWMTDVDVQNGDNRPATFRYLWLPRNTDNASPAASDTFTLAAGEALRHVDVLHAAFGVSDGTDAYGALAVVSDSGKLHLFTRTYNKAMGGAMGTYGQGLPGYPADQLIPASTRKRLLFFTENAAFRSNIGLLNGIGSPIVVRWQRFLANGTLVDSGSAQLPAWGNTQINRVFAGEAPVEAAYIDVWTETEGGAFTAYGSVVDNVNSDATTVLPQ